MQPKSLKVIITIAIVAVGFIVCTYLPIWFNIDISKPGTGCAQVIVSAKNIITREVRTFSDPCHVPFGWNKVK